MQPALLATEVLPWEEARKTELPGLAAEMMSKPLLSMPPRATVAAPGLLLEWSVIRLYRRRWSGW
jgi:hypothetical protein